jgi:hypothetical protein
VGVAQITRNRDRAFCVSYCFTVLFFESSDWRAIRLQRPPGFPSSLAGFNWRRIERAKPPIPRLTIPRTSRRRCSKRITQRRSADRPIATHIKGSRDARCRFGLVTVIQRPDGTAGKIAKALIFGAQMRSHAARKPNWSRREMARRCQGIESCIPTNSNRALPIRTRAALRGVEHRLDHLGGNVESSPRQGDGRFDRERPQQGAALREHLQNSSAACGIGLRAAPEAAMSPNDRSAT